MYISYISEITIDVCHQGSIENNFFVSINKCKVVYIRPLRKLETI